MLGMSNKLRTDEWLAMPICFVLFFVAFPKMLAWSAIAARWPVVFAAECFPGINADLPSRVFTTIGVVVFLSVLFAVTEAVKWFVRQLVRAISD
jgi:hypothetical protein